MRTMHIMDSGNTICASKVCIILVKYIYSDKSHSISDIDTHPDDNMGYAQYTRTNMPQLGIVILYL